MLTIYSLLSKNHFHQTFKLKNKKSPNASNKRQQWPGNVSLTPLLSHFLTITRSPSKPQLTAEKNRAAQQPACTACSGRQAGLGSKNRFWNRPVCAGVRCVRPAYGRRWMLEIVNDTGRWQMLILAYSAELLLNTRKMLTAVYKNV